MIAETLAATVGAAVLQAVSVSGTNDRLCTPVPGPGVLTGQIFIIELIITFVLVFTVFASNDLLRGFSGSGPLAIGLAASMCHFWAVCSRSVLLSRVSILLLTRDIDIVILSVCPSVRPSVCLSGCLSVRLSVTRWYCMKTA